MNGLMRRVRGLVECPRCGSALASGREMIDHWLSTDPDSACFEYGYCASTIECGPDRGRRCGQSKNHVNHQVWHHYLDEPARPTTEDAR